MKTEIIAGYKPVPTKKGNRVIVITQSGQQIWVLPEQHQADAETISYNPRKAGEKYTDKNGAEQALQADRNDLVAFGKQIVKKHSTLEVMDYLMSKGVTPAFNM